MHEDDGVMPLENVGFEGEASDDSAVALGVTNGFVELRGGDCAGDIVKIIWHSDNGGARHARKWE